MTLEIKSAEPEARKSNRIPRTIRCRFQLEVCVCVQVHLLERHKESNYRKMFAAELILSLEHKGGGGNLQR